MGDPQRTAAANSEQEIADSSRLPTTSPATDRTALSSNMNAASQPGEAGQDQGDIDFLDDLLRQAIGSSAGLRTSHLFPRRLGSFELLKRLGSGTMGVVYEARDLRNGTFVALKTIHPSWHGSITFFKQEFRALADLSHPNLATLGEMHAAGDQCYFTMEMIRGSPFLDHFRGGFDSGQDHRPHTYDADAVRDAFRQLGLGIQALHEAGKMHRDIKPGNVMVRLDGRVVLLDFGLAVELTDDIYTNTLGDISGTPLYMSPEQFAGKSIPLASDWYSLGVLLFEALTGKTPFTCASPAELQQQKLATHRPRPRDVLPEAPEDLDQLCFDLLNPDPQLRPSGNEVLQRLGAKTTPTLAKTSLLGRDTELVALQDALAEVQAGTPVIVSISGRSGVGKTELANACLAQIRRQTQAVVLRGRCSEGESVPYKALDGIVDALARYLKRLSRPVAQGLLPLDLGSLCRIFPVLREVPAVAATPFRPEIAEDLQDVRRRGFAALRELLTRLGRTQLLVLFVDDLHWGDPDSASLLEDLFCPPQTPLCLFISTYRSEQQDAPCIRMLRKHGGTEDPNVIRCREISLGPLTLEDAKRLAVTLLANRASATERQAQVIAEESGGDPLFVRVLANSVLATGQDEVVAGGNTWSLQKALLTQINQLSVEARAVLEVASVAACPVSRSTILQMVDVGPDPLVVFQQLKTQRLLRAGGVQQTHVEVYHDKIRETVVQYLSKNQLADISLRLANTVVTNSELVDPEWLAGLLIRAGERSRAANYLLSAAQTAQKTLAFSRAIQLYRNALESFESQSDKESEIRAALGDCLAHAGYGLEAAQEYLLAATKSGPDATVDLRIRAALRYLTGGHLDSGIDALRQVLAAVGWRLPTRPWISLFSLGWHRAKLRLVGMKYRPRSNSDLSGPEQRKLDACWCAAAGLSVIDPIRAADFVSRNMCLSLHAPQPRYYARALSAHIGHSATGGNRSRRRVHHLLCESRQFAESQGDPYSQAAREIGHGISAHLQGRWLPAKHCCDRAVRFFLHEDCHDVVWELTTARTFALWALMYIGDINELAARQPLLLRQAQERNDLFALLNFGTTITAIVQLGADQPGWLRGELEEQQQRLSKSGFFVQHHHWLMARTFLGLYEQDGKSAWDTIANAWKSYRPSFLGRVQLVQIEFLQLQGRAAVAAAAQGFQTSVMLRIADRIVGRLFRKRVLWGQAMAEAISAGAAAVRDNRQVATECLRRAIHQFRATHMDLFAGAAKIQLGRLLNNDEGNHDVNEGLADLQRLGVANPLKMADAMVSGIRTK